MKNSYRITCLSALLLAFTFAAVLSAQSKDLPEIRIALGMESKEVEKRSTVPVEFKKTAIGSDDFRTVHALVPHRFVYEHGERGFVLSEAKGISMAATSGRISQIDVNPQLSFLKIDDAIEQCRKLIALLDQKGWARNWGKFENLYSGDTRKTYESLEAIRDGFVDPNLDEKFEGVRIASWNNGVERMRLDLDRKRFHQPAPPDRREEEKYLVTLTFAYSVTPPPWVPGPRRKLP